MRNDSRDLFRRAAAVTAATINGVGHDQLELPTPCTELDVRALLAHLVGVADRTAAIGRGENAMTVSGTRAVSGDDWASAFAGAVSDFEAAWNDEDAMTRTVVLPWATGPGGEILLGYVNELVVHTWDLGQATGQRPTWDDDVVDGAWRAIAGSLPAEGRTAMFEAIQAQMAKSGAPAGFGGAPFAEAVPAPESATPIERLIAYTGRNPF